MIRNTQLLRLILPVSALTTLCVMSMMIFTSQIIYDYNPSWSPDGQFITFICHRPTLVEAIQVVIGISKYYGDIPYHPKNAEICLMSSDGDNRQQLTHNHAWDYDPTWSPDGRQIAFISTDNNRPVINVMDWDGSNLRPMKETDGVTNMTWSPDGEYIALSRFDGYNTGTYQGGIYLLHVEDGIFQQLLNGPYGHPMWSPDGSKIAYIARGQIDSPSDECVIHVIELRNRNNTVIPATTICNEAPAWSSDANYLAFIGEQANQINVFSFQDRQIIFTLQDTSIFSLNGLIWSHYEHRMFSLSGGGVISILVDDVSWEYMSDLKDVYLMRVRNLPLSPDDKQLAFVKIEGVNNSKALIWKINSDGSNPVRLSP